MPIQIQELIIRATVERDSASTSQSTALRESERRRVIEDCVEQVLEILRSRKEP